MFRKCSTLAVAALAVAAGLTWAADDDDSPTHKLMEKVNAKNLLITKGVRTKVNYAKAQKDVVVAAQDLAKLGKEARDDPEPAKKQKKTQAEYQKLMDDMIKQAGVYAELVGKPATKQDQAKSGYTKVKATCTACHNVFNVEEDEK